MDETETATCVTLGHVEDADFRFRVVVTDGPDAGKSLVLDSSRPSRVLVGSSSACDLVLSDALVSRRHFALDLSGVDLRISDLSSKNGSYANGIRVFEALLRDGDEVTIGRTRLKLTALTDDTPPAALPDVANFGRLVGASRAMRRLYPLCTRVASSTLPVIVEGETGTGKELLAECLHEVGPRRNGPFVVFDCAGTPPALVAPSLFGVAGDAGSGVFAHAHGGTLFLDEVGELDTEVQASLLRAVDCGEVKPIGARAWHTFDVRVIAASQRDLEQEVQRGRFREDLFYRLSVGRIELPPLRLRDGDVSVLAEYFWRRLGGGMRPIPREFLPRYEGYSWPGNVRELRNAVARLASFGAFETRAAVDMTGDPIGRALAANMHFVEGRECVVREYERRFVEQALKKHNGNVSRAAAASGLARRYFYVIRARSMEPGGKK